MLGQIFKATKRQKECKALYEQALELAVESQNTYCQVCLLAPSTFKELTTSKAKCLSCLAETAIYGGDAKTAEDLGQQVCLPTIGANFLVDESFTGFETISRTGEHDKYRHDFVLACKGSTLPKSKGRRIVRGSGGLFRKSWCTPSTIPGLSRQRGVCNWPMRILHRSRGLSQSNIRIARDWCSPVNVRGIRSAFAGTNGSSLVRLPGS